MVDNKIGLCCHDNMDQNMRMASPLMPQQMNGADSPDKYERRIEENTIIRDQYSPCNQFISLRKNDS